MVIFASPESAHDLMADLRRLPQTERAAIIGSVIPEPVRMVLIETELGAGGTGNVGRRTRASYLLNGKSWLGNRPPNRPHRGADKG
jgi:hypothetical protein